MTQPGSTHMPDDHAGHDRQLVVAFASGDLPAEDVADAQALVARCRRCAALVDEIARIGNAMRLDLVPPPRPRDFRISSADAERLRGSALTRLMRRLASPRLQVLQPLAGAAMIIGLLLVATSAVSFGFASAGAAPLMSTVGSATGDDAARDAAGGAQAPAAAEVAPGSPSAQPAASALAAQSPDIAAYTDTSTKANALQLATASPPVDPVIPVGAGLVIVGALLLIVRLEARRATRDPLLR
ncbi:MAG TPA: hypothetical protein VIF44_01880 [Candidatus Limnocylindrales bacterium]|jgi:hypothetical protein